MATIEVDSNGLGGGGVWTAASSQWTPQRGSRYASTALPQAAVFRPVTCRMITLPWRCRANTLRHHFHNCVLWCERGHSNTLPCESGRGMSHGPVGRCESAQSVTWTERRCANLPRLFLLLGDGMRAAPASTLRVASQYTYMQNLNINHPRTFGYLLFMKTCVRYSPTWYDVVYTWYSICPPISPKPSRSADINRRHVLLCTSRVPCRCQITV